MTKSIKGVEVNFNQLRQENGKMVAIGNAKLNARGDLLGKGGKIIKTREELALEYNTNVKNSVKAHPVSQPVDETPPAKVKNAVKPHEDKESVKKAPKKRAKTDTSSKE